MTFNKYNVMKNYNSLQRNSERDKLQTNMTSHDIYWIQFIAR